MSKRKQVQVPIEKIQEQDRFIEAIAEKNSRFYAIHQTKPKYMIQTFGCQMNEHDSEKLCAMLDDMGYQRTMLAAECDLIIYNTCAVRENAELKVYGNLGQLKFNKRKNPDLKIAVCGCMMQQEGMADKILRKFPYVNIIFGTHNAYKFPEYLNRVRTEGVQIKEIFNKETDIVEGLPIDRESDVKAFVTIMYGCNNFCTYCVVPYVRGRERSRRPEEIEKEIKELVAQGYKEITLLGQNVNSYGKDLGEDYNFSNLLEDVAKTNIPRIRFTTSHPWDFSEDMIKIIAKYDNIMPAIHLPVQSGNNEVLKLMGRRYSREQYLELFHKIKEYIPDCTVTTDIIVGFPNETHEQYLDTLSLYQECEYDLAYTFVYSPRAGTPAAKMVDNVASDEKDQRLYKLNEIVNEKAYKQNQRFLNKIVEVLVEGTSKKDDSMLTGYTRHQKLVNFKGDPKDIGKIIKVKITESKTWALKGESIES